MEVIKNLKLQFGYQPEQELKGSDIIRDSNNLLMVKISESILSAGLPIVSVVVERKFMITALLVDDFFDPVYNGNVGNEWTHPIPIRSQLANHFYDNLSNETISLAAHALTLGDRSEIEELINKIEQEIEPVKELNGLNIVNLLQGAKAHTQQLSEVIQEISRRDRNRPIRTAGRTVRSPNIPAFFDLMMRVEYLYSDIPSIEVELIFDSSAQFDQSFADLVNAGITSGPAKLIFPDAIPITFGFTAVNSFSVTDSGSNPLLQVVDFYATGIRRTFDLFALDEQPESLNEASMFYLGFVAHIFPSDTKNFIISDYMLGRLWATLQKYAPN